MTQANSQQCPSWRPRPGCTCQACQSGASYGIGATHRTWRERKLARLLPQVPSNFQYGVRCNCAICRATAQAEAEAPFFPEKNTPARAGKKPCACGCAHCSGHHPEWEMEGETSDEISGNTVAAAIAYNRNNAARVGWASSFDAIVAKVLRLNYSPDGLMFATLVADWQFDNGLVPDGKLGPGTWAKMRQALAPNGGGSGAVNAPGGIEDFTQQATPQQCAAQRKGESCLGGTRPATQIDAIVLHQTAGGQSVNPQNYLWVGAHFVVLPNGRILQLYPETRVVYHANSFNSRSVGIEFAGTFANDQGKCWWPTKKYVNQGHTSGGLTCGQPTAAQIQAGRKLVAALTKKIPSIRYIFAHRQASASRENDPGPMVWLQVGEWAKARISLSDGGNYKVGSGNPIPPSWKQGTIVP